MPAPSDSADPSLTPAQCAAWRAAQGLTHDQVARRCGIPADSLRRFESGEDVLTESQSGALGRALRPLQPPPQRRPLLDFGLAGSLLFLLGGGIPAAMALVTGVDALRFVGAEQAIAEVTGFERRTRIAEPEHGDRYSYETLAPLLRFRLPETGRDVTVAGRETLPHETALAPGQRVWVAYPRGAPERFVLSLADVMLTPLLCAAMAAPLLGIGIMSLRHLQRRSRG